MRLVKSRRRRKVTGAVVVGMVKVKIEVGRKMLRMRFVKSFLRRRLYSSFQALKWNLCTAHVLCQWSAGWPCKLLKNTPMHRYIPPKRDAETGPRWISEYLNNWDARVVSFEKFLVFLFLSALREAQVYSRGAPKLVWDNFSALLKAFSSSPRCHSEMAAGEVGRTTEF